MYDCNNKFTIIIFFLFLAWLIFVQAVMSLSIIFCLLSLCFVSVVLMRFLLKLEVYLITASFLCETIICKFNQNQIRSHKIKYLKLFLISSNSKSVNYKVWSFLNYQKLLLNCKVTCNKTKIGSTKVFSLYIVVNFEAEWLFYLKIYYFTKSYFFSIVQFSSDIHVLTQPILPCN